MSPWVRADDHFDEDPRIATIGVAGAGLLIMLLAYSNRNLADGFAPASIVLQKTTTMSRAEADALTAAMTAIGIMEPADRNGIPGFQIHADFVGLQPTRQQIEDERAAAKTRKERWKERHGIAAGTRSEREGNNEGRHEIGSGSPLPDPDPDPDPEKITKGIFLVAPTREIRPEPTASGPAVLTFPVVGCDPPVWGLTQSQVDDWQRLYPNIDVLAECQKALGWVVANQAKRKTRAGMPRFLNAWLGRAVDTRRGPVGSGVPIGKTAGNLAAAERFLQRGRG